MDANYEDKKKWFKIMQNNEDMVAKAFQVAKILPLKDITLLFLVFCYVFANNFWKKRKLSYCIRINISRPKLQIEKRPNKAKNVRNFFLAKYFIRNIWVWNFWKLTYLCKLFYRCKLMKRKIFKLRGNEVNEKMFCCYFFIANLFTAWHSNSFVF